MRTVFEKSIEMAYSVIGTKTISFYKTQIIPIANSIVEEFLDVVTSDQEFIDYITSTTDKPDRIQYRAETWKQRLQSLVASKSLGNFTSALKQQLYENPTCQLCKQKIREVDDAEVGHIPHYWREAKQSRRMCD
jgi:hypothetical protein